MGFLQGFARIGRPVKNAAAKTIQLFTHRRQLRWRSISTAPSNQELELRFVEDGKVSALEFPCLRTNEGAWIDVDLGNEIKIEPTEWRLWPHRKSPHAHHTRIRANDRSELIHLHGEVSYRDTVGDE